MGHLRAFLPAVLQCFFAGHNLVFITVDLFRHGNRPNTGSPQIKNTDLLRVVDILHLDITLVSIEHAQAVRLYQHGTVQDGHPSVLEGQRETVLCVHACLPFHTGGRHVFDISGERHAGKIQRIHTEIQQSSAAEFRPHHPLHMCQRISQISAQGCDVSDHLAVDQVQDHLPAWHIAGPDRLGQQKSLLLCQADHFPRLLRVHRKRLLTEDVFPVLQSQLCVGIMHRMGRRHIDQIHLRIADQFFIGTVRFRKPLRLRKGFRTGQFSGSHGIRFHIFSPLLQAAHCRSHGLCNIARAKNRYFHHSLSPYFFLYFS